jgi:hypothetical protein
MCCLSLSFVAADNTFKVLEDSFLPLCSAKTKVENVFLMRDLINIFLQYLLDLFICQVYIFVIIWVIFFSIFMILFYLVFPIKN